jgi:hypothetical protein
MHFFSFICFLLSSGCLLAQQTVVTGKITNSDGKPVAGANISVSNGNGSSSDESGEFEIKVPPAPVVVLVFSHINYITHRDTISALADNLHLLIRLKEKTTLLKEVSVHDKKEHEQVSLVKLKPKNLLQFPSPSPDISRVLASLPGVVNNSELSSSYSVRGGNFDENLIFVEGIQIYKPQIANNGRQEGLGFVNLHMVEEVNFSSGGWGAEFGGKLSSVLTIDYKEPQELTANVDAGLLGGSITVGSKVGKTSFIAGLRHKNTRYLLNSLETEGEYFPKFTDFQFYTTTAINSTTSLAVIGGGAHNRYEVFPATRETEFGTFSQSYRLTVGFEGRDVLSYDTYQGGVKLQKQWSPDFSSSFIISAVNSIEREYTEVEGGYRLCDVNKNVGSPDFNECAVVRGMGRLYDHRRNYLQSELLHLEWQSEIELSNEAKIEGGFSWDYDFSSDRLAEYDFTDSAGYVTEVSSLNVDQELKKNRATGFLQWVKSHEKHSFNLGSRFVYRALNNEIQVSPRLRYSFRPNGRKDLVWKFATGIYRQAPVYRELRDVNGNLNKNLKMQSSWHIISGMDKDLTMWDRPFKLVTEAYYKYLWNVNPYEVNNVRIRYFGNNEAKAFATGADFRLSGEFIKNTESWFSLGFLSTKEDISGDRQGYIRRPMDQRVTMAIFFQDHLPDNPSFRVNVHVQIGTGLPFGPPDDIEKRNSFNGAAYRRVDVGFSKVFGDWRGLDNFIISAEILNLTGSRNVISYTWIEDVFDQKFAVPNGLSTRFFNLRFSVSI